MTKLWVWRDSRDSSQLNFGTKCRDVLTPYEKVSSYSIHFSMSEDAVWELWGIDKYDELRKQVLPGATPTTVEMTLE